MTKKGTRGVIWEYEFYEGFDLNQDRTFFYSFPGDVRCYPMITIDCLIDEIEWQDCMVGFAFSDESEAADLNKKVQNRKKYAGT